MDYQDAARRWRGGRTDSAASSREVTIPSFEVPESEIEFRTSRSGGPGGQHVNRRETRVEASWDLSASPSLSEEQRDRLMRKLASRLEKGGVLRVVVDEERSQHRNREIAVRRLRELVTDGLRVRKKRKPTKPPRAAKERRLRQKRRRKQKKEKRQPPHPEE